MNQSVCEILFVSPARVLSYCINSSIEIQWDDSALTEIHSHRQYSELSPVDKSHDLMSVGNMILGDSTKCNFVWYVIIHSKDISTKMSFWRQISKWGYKRIWWQGINQDWEILSFLCRAPNKCCHWYCIFKSRSSSFTNIFFHFKITIIDNC